MSAQPVSPSNRCRHTLSPAAAGRVLALVVALIGLPAIQAPGAIAQGVPYPLPLAGKNKGTPLLMINMSKDHQLSYRAYVEYADLDGDGILETTYKHAIEYYGYFDAHQCYQYKGGVFQPVSHTLDRYCAGGAWAGNFLNWATMTRMDVVRRILYGGYRSTDSAAATVLERAYLPTDAHSFAKHYSGPDIARLTPFGVSQISICNTTLGGGGANQRSHTNTNPPLMRVAAGNYQLWNNNERWQCYWAEEKDAGWSSDPADKARTGLDAEIRNPSRSAVGLGAALGGPDFIVRVQSCVGGGEGSKASSERCLRYPSGNRKPIGLLHDYGQDDRMMFGLMTGSFERNVSGGVLRRNVGRFRDEVNAETDGTFKPGANGIVWNIDRLRIYGYNYGDGSYIPDDNCPYQMIGLTNGRCRSWGNPMSEIYTEALRYFVGQGNTPTPAFVTSGGADAQLGLSTEPWKDPFKPDPSGKKLPGVNQCSPMHILNFNASVSSWDRDEVIDVAALGAPKSTMELTAQVGAGEGLYSGKRPIGHAGGSDGLCTPKAITHLGQVHGLCPEAPTQQGSFLMAGAAYWAKTQRIRNDWNAKLPADTDEFKPMRVNTLGVAMATNTPVIRIPVPGAAGSVVTLQPTYLLDRGAQNGSGTLVDFRVVYQDLAAGHGRFYVNWEDSEQGGDYDQDASGYIKYWFSPDRTRLHVETLVTGYSSGNPQGFGYIITGTQQDGPRFHSGAANFSFAPATPVDVFRPTPATAGNREPTLQTPRLNGQPGSRINLQGGCASCVSSGGWDGGGGLPTVAVYQIGGTVAAPLRDPMWYAAKWGGFKDIDGNGVPSSVSEWAPRNRTLPQFRALSDAAAAGVVPPDNYFFAANPGELPDALREALVVIDTDSSRSGVAVSTRTLVSPELGGASTSAFTARFKGDWSGDLIAWSFDAQGKPVEGLKAASLLAARKPADRRIAVRTDAGAVWFEWSRIGKAAQDLLDLSPRTGKPDGLGSRRLDWLRGDPKDDETRGGTFRQRPSPLGAIVNSTPLFVGAPRGIRPAGLPDAGYKDFKRAQASRPAMVYVGSNSGMLHGFDAVTLQERIAYVPRALLPKLPKLTDPQYVHEYFVDGSPFTADIRIDGAWATMVYGALGAGGQGLFGLDVTRPDQFSGPSFDPSGFARWEFSDADDPDMGYVIGEASPRFDFQANQVATLGNGERYLVIGNGVASDANDGRAGPGRAALFILRAAGPVGANWALGVDYFKIVIDTALGGAKNGLAMPYLVDTDEDGKVDVAYAGDLNGNVWKFDLRSASPSAWSFAPNGKPFFVARDPAGKRQPITAAPVAANLGRSVGGVMVVVGTGRYYQLTDATNTDPQTVYGLWDNGKGAIASRDDLVAQTFTGVTGTAGGSFREMSANKVCLATTQAGCSAMPTGKRGWRLELGGGKGERVVYNPLIDGGADLLLTTTVPGDVESCVQDGETWFFRLSLLSGTTLNQGTYDTDGDGKVGGPGDAKTSAIRREGVTKPMQLVQQRSECAGLDCARKPCLGAQGTGSGAAGSIVTACARVDANRLNWREILR
jgi:type IV pilus assembly protein PilY1